MTRFCDVSLADMNSAGLKKREQVRRSSRGFRNKWRLFEGPSFQIHSKRFLFGGPVMSNHSWNILTFGHPEPPKHPRKPQPKPQKPQNPKP